MLLDEYEIANTNFSNLTGDSSLNNASSDGNHEQMYNLDIRLIVLIVQVGVGTLGVSSVFLWLWCERRRPSRVNKLVLQVTLADALVIDVACVSQLIWTLQDDRAWVSNDIFGDFLCKLVTFLQSFAMISSSFMLLVLAFDRHQAILYPLKRRFSVWVVTGTAWALAGLASVPQMIVFHTDMDNNTVLCESGFGRPGRPKWHRQAYITFITVVIFYIPTLLLIFCYTSVFITIAKKAREQRGPRKDAVQNGCKGSERVYLQSTASVSINRAKTKTLIMTIVIVLVFIICSAPYHVVEMIIAYAPNPRINSIWFAISGGAASANSCANPFIFLLFNVKRRGKRRKRDSASSTRTTTHVITGSTKTHNGAHYSKLELQSLTNQKRPSPTPQNSVKREADEYV